MTRLVLGILLASLLNIVSYADSNIELLSVNVDIRDPARLQRGARLFMNYCSGCHALRYLRYNVMAKDLQLTSFTGELDTELLSSNLIFTTAKPQDPIQIALPKADARQWFGVEPPDLSLTARERGPAWIYTYLKSFYVDATRPFGSNNLVVPNVAMPNVLEPLRGQVVPVYKDKGKDKKASIEYLFVAKSGEMDEQQFNSSMEDLVSFLTYVAEPAKLVRYRIGVGVLIFLSILLLLAYQMKKLYWKDKLGYRKKTGRS